MDKANNWQGFPRGITKREIIGYSSCFCREGFRPGIVLDPFAGAGTTCVVARKLGRDFIGMDINPEYCEMAWRRIAAVPERLHKLTGDA